MDIVIPYEYREEDDMSLKYELRSFEKNELLNNVGTVYILMDTVEHVDKMKMRYGSYITQQQQQQQQITTTEENKTAAATDKNLLQKENHGKKSARLQLLPPQRRKQIKYNYI